MQYLFYLKAHLKKKLMADWIRTNAPDVLMELWPEIEASIAKREEAQSVETK